MTIRDLSNAFATPVDAEPTWVGAIRSLLLGLGYTEARACACASYCWLYNTATGCDQFIYPAHDYAAEQLIPDAPASDWDFHGDYVWVPTEDAADAA